MTAPRPVPDERHARPFTDWLLKQGKGKLAAELTDRFDELVQAVHITGKPGTLVLSVTLKPLEKGNGDVLTITDKVAVKMPTSDRLASIFFVDDNATLTTNDPNQLSLDLKEVPALPATPDLKEAGPTA
jgi:hypothetical protein